MSSLRNAVKRKTHKERAQPERRKKLGLLEKKKDYVLRAKDYHRKKDALVNLERKAAFRNPDEFYFKMVNTRLKDGVHWEQKDQTPEDVVKLIRSQNAAYVQYHETVEARKINKMKENLHFLNAEAKPVNRHTVFLDDDENPETFSKEEYFETTKEFADRTFNRPKVETLTKGKLVLNGSGRDLKEAAARRQKTYKELEARMDRQEKLSLTLSHMQMYKNLGGKGTKFKVKEGSDGKPAVYRWKQERKR